jgi:transposase-like protein
MKQTPDAPTTLSEAVIYFADPDLALAFLVEMRWPNGVRCPHCNAASPSFLKTRRIWKCSATDCRKQFSAKVGTIFEDSPLVLNKWLPALWMLANSRNGISSYELGRHLGVTQKTGWFMLGRIRLAMQTKSFKKMSGEVEADESFIGGIAKNMHAKRHKRMIRSGQSGKVTVLGLLERKRGDKHSRVQTTIVPNTGSRTLQREIVKSVEAGAAIYTDANGSYVGLREQYKHDFVDHQVAYVKGRVHTNGLENFWSLLKRSIKGTYVSVDPFHLFRYLDEQAFRFNNRKVDDGDRFVTVLRDILGKRLTYRVLTGAHLKPATT